MLQQTFELMTKELSRSLLVLTSEFWPPVKQRITLEIRLSVVKTMTDLAPSSSLLLTCSLNTQRTDNFGHQVNVSSLCPERTLNRPVTFDWCLIKAYPSVLFSAESIIFNNYTVLYYTIFASLLIHSLFYVSIMLIFPSYIFCHISYVESCHVFCRVILNHIPYSSCEMCHRNELDSITSNDFCKSL